MNILRLKELLKEKGISGKELSEKIEVSEMTISNIVQGNNFPKPENLLKIAETLNVDVRELFVSTKETDKEILYIKREGNYLPIGTINIP